MSIFIDNKVTVPGPLIKVDNFSCKISSFERIIRFWRIDNNNIFLTTLYSAHELLSHFNFTRKINPREQKASRVQSWKNEIARENFCKRVARRAPCQLNLAAGDRLDMNEILLFIKSRKTRARALGQVYFSRAHLCIWQDLLLLPPLRGRVGTEDEKARRAPGRIIQSKKMRCLLRPGELLILICPRARARPLAASAYGITRGTIVVTMIALIRYAGALKNSLHAARRVSLREEGDIFHFLDSRAGKSRAKALLYSMLIKLRLLLYSWLSEKCRFSLLLEVFGVYWWK